jgi:ketosteroid isomerase-like protein
MYLIKSALFIIVLFAVTGCKVKVEIETGNSDKVLNEVKEKINEAYSVWQTKDIDAIRKIYAKDAIVFGTDAAEYFVGIDALESTFKAQMKAIDDPVFSFKDETITISNNADMASYIHKIDMSFTMDGKPMQMKDTRVTGVLKKTKSGWRHVQAHWSIGIQGQAIEY